MERMMEENRRGEHAGGNLPYTAPTYWGGGGPAWSGFCVTLPWEVHRRYGDVRILKDNLHMVERWLEFLETKAENNLLRRYGGEWDFLGDWLWPGARGTNGNTRETLFFNNCYWIYNLQTAAKIAGALGKEDLAGKYRRRAEQVRRTVHGEFFDDHENGYVNNLQAMLAIALLVDLPPEDLRPAVWKRFEEEILERRRGHFWGGITGGAFIVKALLDLDRPDLLYEMATKEDYPGWGDMLRRGATTLWEAWDGRNSHLHSSFLHIGSWFIGGLAGIQPDPEVPGFKRFLIKPALLKGNPLTWVRGEYDSQYGTILSHWRVEEGKLKLEVTVPPNTTARVFLPATDPDSVREGGRPLGEAEGVKPGGKSGDRLILELCPGNFKFETAIQ
jgi:hypothetical protein